MIGLALLALIVASLLKRGGGGAWPTPPIVPITPSRPGRSDWYTPMEIPPMVVPRARDAPPGGEPPLVPPDVVPPPRSTPAEVSRPYTIRSGDYPSGMSQRMTGNAGRWREIMPLNPELRTTQTTTPQGQPVTYVVPWQIGQIILLPRSWFPA